MRNVQNNKLYNLFFPEGKDRLPFRKLRWFIMTLIQELSMKKFRAVFKLTYNKSYRSDILTLMDVLSKGKLQGSRSRLLLKDIHPSHEINYPKWVDKLRADLKVDPDGYKPLKVFRHDDGHYFVVDGNHRLEAMTLELDPETPINVLVLTYKDPSLWKC